MYSSSQIVKTRLQREILKKRHVFCVTLAILKCHYCGCRCAVVVIYTSNALKKIYCRWELSYQYLFIFKV